MTDIDKLEEKIDKLVEQIRDIAFPFEDDKNAEDAEASRDEAISLLENYLDLANQDWEGRDADSDDGDEEDSLT